MHSELIALINGEFRSSKQCLLAELLPMFASNRTARQLVEQYASLRMASKVEGDNVSIVLQPCKIRNTCVQRMQVWLDQYVKDDILLAMLHGSLGINEVVPYSDFDALVIIKDEVLKDSKRLARVAHRLFQSRRFMYEQDPLQHHGWFVLPEQALSSWPEDYLPVEVLRYSSVLTESEPVKLALVSEVNTKRCEAALLRMSQGVKREITSGTCFLNLYRFKSMISKVLLIPTLYIQVRDGRGVFKRDSFDLAKVDFSAKEWLPVDVASKIRQQWPLLNEKEPHFLAERPGLLGNIWRKKRRQPVPEKFREQFNEDVVYALQNLIRLMEKSIEIQ